MNGIVKNDFGGKAEERGLKLGGEMDMRSIDFDTTETDKSFRLEWVTVLILNLILFEVSP